MCLPRIVAALLLLGSAPLGASEQPMYPGPWEAATQAAAEAAVARMGTNRAIDIQRQVLEILRSAQGVAGASGGIAGASGGIAGASGGITGARGGITAASGGITATVQELHQAMQALGAKETALEVTVSLPADVLFDFDKAEIRSDAAAALARLATVIRGYPTGRAEIQGHTDAKGNAAYNQRLSERRAASVKRWLVEQEKIAADRLATRGFGKSRPVASNDTEAGRQTNRRVEVVIQKGR